MTAFRLFTHRRDVVRWLVLTVAMAALACGPAAPTSPGAGETAANAADSNQPPSDGAEPIVVPQQANGTDETPTPRPTTCVNTVDEHDNPRLSCGPPPPLQREKEFNVGNTLLSEMESVQQREADRRRNSADADNSQIEPLIPERYRVWIQLDDDDNGNRVKKWLTERDFKYEDHSDVGTIYAAIDITTVIELSQVEGVSFVRKPRWAEPAH